MDPTLPVPHGDLSPAAVRYIVASRAKNTRLAYEKDWADFTYWCDSRRLIPLPAAPTTVINYLTALAEAGAKVGTIARQFSTINRAHDRAGYTKPGKDEDVADAWAGIRRTHGVAPDQAPALMPPDNETGDGDLWTVVDALPDTPTGHRDAALLLLGFVGALRRSDLVAAQVEHLKPHPRGYVLRIPRSKGDQEGKGQRVAVPRFEDRGHCPVAALDRWLDLLDRPTVGPLFRRIRRHQSITADALAVGAVNLIVGRACTAALGPGHGYTPHSLRAGLVTWTARQKAPLSAIKKQTRHAFEKTVEGYVRDETVWQDNAAVDYLNL